MELIHDEIAIHYYYYVKHFNLWLFNETLVVISKMLCYVIGLKLGGKKWITA